MPATRWLLRCIGGSWGNGSTAVSSLVVNKPDYEGSLTGYLYALALTLTLAAQLSIVVTGAEGLPVLLAIAIGLDDFWQKLNII